LAALCRRQARTEEDGRIFFPSHITIQRCTGICLPLQRLAALSSTQGRIMHQRIALGLAILAGVAIGATAIQGLHAQAKPPVYAVIPILKVTDADAFKQIGPKADAAMPAGGHYIIRSDKITPLDGTPPQRLVIIAFDSMEQAQAWHNTAAQKEIDDLRAKSTTSLSFLIEGMAK
jgi:uncharacterized protein (DUF1330 family)